MGFLITPSVFLHLDQPLLFSSPFFNSRHVLFQDLLVDNFSVREDTEDIRRFLSQYDPDVVLHIDIEHPFISEPEKPMFISC